MTVSPLCENERETVCMCVCVCVTSDDSYPQTEEEREREREDERERNKEGDLAQCHRPFFSFPLSSSLLSYVSLFYLVVFVYMIGLFFWSDRLGERERGTRKRDAKERVCVCHSSGWHRIPLFSRSLPLPSFLPRIPRSPLFAPTANSPGEVRRDQLEREARESQRSSALLTERREEKGERKERERKKNAER